MHLWHIGGRFLRDDAYSFTIDTWELSNMLNANRNERVTEKALEDITHGLYLDATFKGVGADRMAYWKDINNECLSISTSDSDLVIIISNAIKDNFRSIPKQNLSGFFSFF